MDRGGHVGGPLMVNYGVVIRPATESDVAQLEALWSTWYIHAALERARGNSLDYLVACLDDRVIGQLCIDTSAIPGTAYIFAVSVHPDQQSKGVGTHLLEAAEQRTIAAGIAALTLKVEHSNPRAQSLYERLGFTVVGDGFDEWDERLADGTVVRHVKVSTWLMRKSLVRV